MPDAFYYIQRLVLRRRQTIQVRRHTLSYSTRCFSQASMHYLGCCQPIQSSMAYTARPCTMRRIHCTLRQGTYLSRRHTPSCSHLQCLLRPVSITIILQGRRLHSCHARVYQVRHYYRHYYCIQAVSQHQAVASYQLSTHTIT